MLAITGTFAAGMTYRAILSGADFMSGAQAVLIGSGITFVVAAVLWFFATDED